MKRTAGRLLRFAIRTTVIASTVVATIWLVRGFDSRSMPELSIWHSYEPENEFHARDYPDGISFGEYQELELRLATELDEQVYATVGSSASESMNRYNKQSAVYAGDASQAWNRSIEIETPNPRGGILLLHGASDSPYSMRAMAELFAQNGLYVVVARLPGHGTVPAGLKYARVADWEAIVRAGVAHVAEKVGADKPVYVGGYSAGATVVLDYTLDAALDDSLRIPERVFLYSPAIAVTPFARFGDWDEALAKIPPFEKLSWMTIETEYDPYKYNSFPKNAGYLTYAFSVRVMSKLNKVLVKSPDALPAIITFQSLIDSTVSTDSIVHDLYQQLPANGSELVLFDFNRSADIQHFLMNKQRPLLTELDAVASMDFAYTLVTNRSAHTSFVEARNKVAGATETMREDLPHAWPPGVYSLSHVAIPFAPTDEWYGAVNADGTSNINSFNAIAPRGDQAILAIPLGRLLRLRYNPFFDYLERRTLEFCAACNATAPGFDATYALDGISFRVSSADNSSLNQLVVEPAGLEIVNDRLETTIDGSVAGAEIADLNGDGSPEIYIYISAAGSGSYGSLTAYSANNRKSVSQIYLPPLSDDEAAAVGYMGHDEFAVAGSCLVRQFPIYERGDTNVAPSGGVRQIKYKLVAGESGWLLKVDAVAELGRDDPPSACP